jgi:phosphoribosylformylglycinamidine synthase
VFAAPAAGRMAVGEAITNLLAAPIALERVKLSCNWMAACSDDPAQPGDDAALYDTVRAVGMELCPALGIGVPVGKDSLSMSTRWQSDGGVAKPVTAPVSLVVTAFASSTTSPHWTPQLARRYTLPSRRDLGGAVRMGGSILAQTSASLATPFPTWMTRRCARLACACPPARRRPGRRTTTQRRRPLGGGVQMASPDLGVSLSIDLPKEARHRRQPRQCGDQELGAGGARREG